MKYAELKILLYRHLPVIDTTLGSEAEIVESAIVIETINAIIGEHSEIDELDTDAIKVLRDMLVARFEDIRRITPLLYTENTVSSVNQFYFALATALQQATGINRFQLLMPSIAATQSLTGQDLDDGDVAPTDFILSSTQERYIDIESCLAASVNDGLLRHTQPDATGQDSVLNPDEVVHLLGHCKEIQEYYDAINKRYAFKRNGTTLGALLQELADGLEEGSVIRQGRHTEYNAAFAANVAIARFASLYNPLPDETKTQLNNLSANGKTFQQIWYILAQQQLEEIARIQNDASLTEDQKRDRLAGVHLKVNTCAKLNYGHVKAIIDQHKQALFAIPVNNQTLQENNIGLFDEAVANAKHWFTTGLWRLRHGKERLSSKISDEQNEALMQLLLPKTSPRLLANSVRTLRAASQFNMVATGAEHTLFLTGAGVAHCVGSNEFGQLGLGKLPGKVVGVFAGWHASFFLNDAGKVYACGLNEHGQLGLGDRQNRHEPTEISIPGTVTRVFPGNDHALVLTDAGKLYAFGSNTYGQLGLGDNDARLAPVEVPGITGRITGVYSGLYHTFLLNDMGKLYAFGSNDHGQLGLGDRNDRNVPTEVTSIPDKITGVFPGFDCTFILTETGTLYALGKNGNGELGQGNYNDCIIPTVVTGIEGKIKSIFARCGSTCILNDAGRLYACGNNSQGQLGLLGRAEHAYKRFEVTGIIEGKITEVFTKNLHAVVLTEAGKLYVSGSNNKGQLGLENNYQSVDGFVELPINFANGNVKSSLLRRLEHLLLEQYLNTVAPLSASPATLFAATRNKRSHSPEPAENKRVKY